MRWLMHTLLVSGSLWIGGRGLAQGAWQGGTPDDSSTPDAAPVSRWLILDSGGSGGSFGQGDLRKHLNDVFFWNDQVGWACGYRGVYKTADGGLSWTTVKGKGGWYHIEMSGPEEVWLLEGFHGQMKGRLWRSRDDGDTWVEVLPETLRGYRDLYCHANQRWILCGDAPSYRSLDGGETWQGVTFGGLLHGAWRIAFPADRPTPDGFPVYVVGKFQNKPRLIRSLDGGETWTVMPLPEGVDTYLYGDLFFVSSTMGWLGAGAGGVWFTPDGGETWVDRSLPVRQRLQALWFDQRGYGFAAVGDIPIVGPAHTLYETRDGGETWTPVLGGAKNVLALFGRGPRRVWGVGDVPGYVINDLVIILRP